MALLDEKTKFAWPIVIALLGGTIWLTNLNAQVLAIARGQEEIKKEQATYSDGQQKILREIARIQGKMGMLPDEK